MEQYRKSNTFICTCKNKQALYTQLCYKVQNRPYGIIASITKDYIYLQRETLERLRYREISQ